MNVAVNLTQCPPPEALVLAWSPLWGGAFVLWIEINQKVKQLPVIGKEDFIKKISRIF